MRNLIKSMPDADAIEILNKARMQIEACRNHCRKTSGVDQFGTELRYQAVKTILADLRARAGLLGSPLSYQPVIDFLSELRSRDLFPADIAEMDGIA